MIYNYIPELKSKVPPLAFHSMNLCIDTLYIYGGITSNDKISGDLIFLNVFSTNYVCARYEANQYIFPSPRHSHSATYDINNNVIYIFGGYTNSKAKFSNEFWMLEPNKKLSKFTKLHTPEKISPRCQHCSFIWKNKLYIFGGYGINTFNLKKEFLVDLYCIELNTNLEKKVNVIEMRTIGEFEMQNSLFKVINLKHYGPSFEGAFGFFCDDLSYFFILTFGENNVGTFTKLETKFLFPEKREFYTITTFQNRLLLLGGKNATTAKEIEENEEMNKKNNKQNKKEKGQEENESYCFNEAYYLIAFVHQKEINFTWRSIDYFSQVNFRGLFGHTAVTLPNENTLIFGGALEPFNPILERTTLFPNETSSFKSSEFLSKNNIEITNNSFIYNPIETYQWQSPINEKIAAKYHLPSRTSHTMIVMPQTLLGKVQDNCNILIIGGENDGKTVCRADIFNYKETDWVPSGQDEFIPQIKNHAVTLVSHPSRAHEVYILISGGFVKDHQGCYAKKNREKERCPCKKEMINTQYFLYKNNKFTEISVVPRTTSKFPLHRIGHNMVTFSQGFASDSEVYLLNGFAQHHGFCFSMVKLVLDFQPKNQELRLLAEDVEFPGERSLSRIHATCNVYQNYIIVFGGIREDTPLNDVLVIDILKKTIERYENDESYIFPRFGLTSVIVTHPYIENQGEEIVRMINFGGTFWEGKNVIYGQTNEIVVFKFSYRNNKLSLEDKVICDVFGKGLKRLFHSSVLCPEQDADYMISYGGIDNKFIVLKIPKIKKEPITTSLNDYVKNNPYVDLNDLFISQNDEKIKEIKALKYTKEEKDKNFIPSTEIIKTKLDIYSRSDGGSTKEKNDSSTGTASTKDVIIDTSKKRKKENKKNKTKSKSKSKSKSKPKIKDTSLMKESMIADVSDISLIKKTENAYNNNTSQLISDNNISVIKPEDINKSGLYNQSNILLFSKDEITSFSSRNELISDGKDVKTASTKSKDNNEEVKPKKQRWVRNGSKQKKD